MRFAPANSKEAPPQIMCKLGKTAGSISSRLTLPNLRLATKHQSFSVHVHFDMYIEMSAFEIIQLAMCILRFWPSVRRVVQSDSALWAPI